jgi:hypothetical protein
MDARKQKYTLRSKYYEKAMNRGYGCVESGSAVPQIHVSRGRMNECSFTVADFWRGPLNPCGMWSDEFAGKEFYLSSPTESQLHKASLSGGVLLAFGVIIVANRDRMFPVVWRTKYLGCVRGLDEWNSVRAVRRMNINTTFGVEKKPTALKRDSFEEQ